MWFHKKFDFSQMLLDQARMSEKGLKILCDFVQRPSSELGYEIKQVEQEADALRRRLIESLNLAFVTPFDREDIFALSRAIDDMVDYADTTAEEMLLFVVSPNDHLRRMAQALYTASQHITAAVEALANIRTSNGHVYENVIRAKKSENLMEHLYREALAELFKSSDVIAILKLREIYRHLNNAADRGDEAADIIGDILVKNA